MTRKRRVSKSSLQKERKFWQSHDAVEVLGEEGWQVIEPGQIDVKSVYIVRSDKRGMTLRITAKALQRLGIKNKCKMQVWIEGGRLIVEPVRGQSK